MRSGAHPQVPSPPPEPARCRGRCQNHHHHHHHHRAAGCQVAWEATRHSAGPCDSTAWPVPPTVTGSPCSSAAAVNGQQAQRGVTQPCRCLVGWVARTRWRWLVAAHQRRATISEAIAPQAPVLELELELELALVLELVPVLVLVLLLVLELELQLRCRAQLMLQQPPREHCRCYQRVHHRWRAQHWAPSVPPSSSWRRRR